MIKLTQQTAQDFLSRYWVYKLLEVGVDMDDASYFIITRNYPNGSISYVVTEDELNHSPKSDTKPIPTYSLTQLIYKLNEWIQTDEIHGPLEFLKDAPYYMWFYSNRKDGKQHGEYYKGIADNPLIAAVRCLINCYKNKEESPNIKSKVSYDTYWNK